MSAGQGRSKTPEPSWVKKSVVGLNCGAAYQDVAFVGNGLIVRLFDFDARVCAFARLFFPDKNVVRVRSQTVETRAGGLRDVGLLTPGQGMPGA